MAALPGKLVKLLAILFTRGIRLANHNDCFASVLKQLFP